MDKARGEIRRSSMKTISERLKFLNYAILHQKNMIKSYDSKIIKHVDKIMGLRNNMKKREKILKSYSKEFNSILPPFKLQGGNQI